MRKTQMHRMFIAAANELGYFPTLQQADLIWRQWDLAMAKWRAENPSAGSRIPDELHNRLTRESIENVLNPKR